MLLQFQKGDLVRHLGLLDLQRTMQRALRRSGLPIGYSNGFNPHIVMTFASALSSGIPGDREILDVTLSAETNEEECMAAMNRVLPPSLQVSRVRLVDDRFPKASAVLEQAEYAVTLYGGDSKKIAEAVPAYLAENEIMALRKTKRSETMVNIRPMLHLLTAEYDAESDRTNMMARVSFVEAATLKPELLLESLSSYAGAQLPVHDVRRTCLLAVRDGQPVPIMDL